MDNRQYNEIGKAGFWVRLGANMLDGFIISLPITIIFLILFGFESNLGELMNNLIYGIYGLVLPIVWYGFTVGKKLVNIQIVKMDGSIPTVGTMLMRNFVAGFVYVLTLGIGFIVSAFMIGLREDKRSLHDLIAGTQVVRVSGYTIPDSSVYNRPVEATEDPSSGSSLNEKERIEG